MLDRWIAGYSSKSGFASGPLMSFIGGMAQPPKSPDESDTKEESKPTQPAAGEGTQPGDGEGKEGDASSGRDEAPPPAEQHPRQDDLRRVPPKKKKADKPPVTIAPSGGSDPDVFI